MYGALLAGSERGQTLGEDVVAYTELGFAPRIADKPAKRDLATTVMGQPISFPVMISPTGVRAVHPDGEVAVARAAATRGTARTCSTSPAAASTPSCWAGPRDRSPSSLPPTS